MSPDAGTIARHREDVLARIAEAAARAGRNPGDVTLMAVTKTHPPETVALAARAGINRFGENRVQEGAAKVAALSAEFPDLEWRLIGPLQSNKAKAALQWFRVIETLDRERLAARLEALLAETGETLPVLLELNLGGEASKAGASPGAVERLYEAALACPHLEVRGVMAVPPYHPDPERSRPYFRQLAGIRDGLVRRFGRALPELSMGMSHDYAVAVEEGATEVRIGTALFGPRPDGADAVPRPRP
jgi:pyridoxal phosphate enzyme (YggS family)